jgi:hypothetical protein
MSAKQDFVHMIDYIRQYYESERNMALTCAGIGLLFLVVAWIAFRQPGDAQLYKGFTYTLLVFGLLFLSALAVLFQSNESKIGDRKLLSDSALQVSELHRIEKVLATGYKVSSIIASVAILAGVALILLNSGNLLKGIGLGLLIFGTALHAIDFFSINKHKVYYDVIRELEF